MELVPTPKRSGKWRPREDGPHERPSTNPQRDRLEILALEALGRAIAYDEQAAREHTRGIRFERLAARERANAIRLGEMATRMGGKPALKLLPQVAQDEPHEDTAA